MRKGNRYMPRHMLIDPEWEWDEEFPLAQGLKVGNFLFLSGQVAFDKDGKVVGKGDLGAQTRQVFQNIQTILSRAGATFSNVVRMTTYFTCPLNMKQSREYFEIRREFFKDHKPASTGVQVASLVHKDLLLEVEVMAILPGSKKARAARTGSNRARAR